MKFWKEKAEIEVRPTKTALVSADNSQGVAVALIPTKKMIWRICGSILSVDRLRSQCREELSNLCELPRCRPVKDNVGE